MHKRKNYSALRRIQDFVGAYLSYYIYFAATGMSSNSLENFRQVWWKFRILKHSYTRARSVREHTHIYIYTYTYWNSLSLSLS